MNQAPGIALYGTSHTLASMDVRERLTLDPENLDAAYAAIRGIDGVDEALVLNTCNRTEVYIAGSLAEPAALRSVLAGLTRTEAGLWQDVERWVRGREAVHHCLRVASGLDSQMIGETEILGQVKKAYQVAVAQAAAGPVIHRLFQHSFRVGKWLRTHTGLGRGQVSAPTVAASLADRIFGKLSGAQILVVGTGEMGEATLKVLMSEGAATPAFTGRNRERVAELARTYEADIVAFEHWKEKLGRFDIVMTSTSAGEWILGCADVQRAVDARRGLPLFLIDLAMPRDIDPAVARLEGTYLYNLDDLAAVANENLEARRAEIDRGLEYVSAEVEALWTRLYPETPRAAGVLSQVKNS